MVHEKNMDVYSTQIWFLLNTEIKDHAYTWLFTYLFHIYIITHIPKYDFGKHTIKKKL